MNRRLVRLCLGATILLIGIYLGFVYYSYYNPVSDQNTMVTYQEQAELPMDEREQLVPTRDGATVITTQVFTTGAGVSGALIAFGQQGRLLHYSERHSTYFDVDPAPTGQYTVDVLAADHLSRDECNSTTTCARVVIEQVNLSTGEVTPLYQRLEAHGPGAKRWHDADRIGDSQRFLIAATGQDEVRITNVSSGITTWQWSAHSEYSTDIGGQYPKIWSHTNDVEYLGNGRIMASPRNMNEVIFLNQTSGMTHSWTLGNTSNRSIVNRQHNPDYIPESEGGPAVIVADSHNDRAVEYQRRDGEWVRSWMWTDDRLAWPRDADRLPSGNTLITDTHGDRIVEVNESGDIIWSMPVEKPYDAERLNTDSESAGGQSAASLDIESQTGKSQPSTNANDGNNGVVRSVSEFVKSLWSSLPSPIVNSIAFIFPPWMAYFEGGLAIIMIGSLFMWGGAELYWRYQFHGFQSPIRFTRRGREETAADTIEAGTAADEEDTATDEE